MKHKFRVLCLLSTLFVLTFTVLSISAEKTDSDKAKANQDKVSNASKASPNSAKSIKSSAIAPSVVSTSKAPAPGTTPSLSKIPAVTKGPMIPLTKKQQNTWKPASDNKLVRKFEKPKDYKQGNPVLNFRNYHAASQDLKAPGSNFKNGGFELSSTTLSDWTAIDLSGSGGWFLQTGTFTPLTGSPVSAPPERLNAAMTDMTGPGTHILYQDFVVPPGAVLSFDFYVQNMALVWAVPEPETLDFNVAPNQHIRVDIMDPGAPVDDVGSGVLMNLFLTQNSDPFTFGYVTATADMSAFAGQTVRLRFAGVETQFFQFFGVDNVRLSAGAIGLVADNITNSVVAFDPKTDVVLTSIPIPANCGVIGGVAISPDGTQGFVTNFCGEVYVIDLKQMPPVLDSGTNPIVTSQAAEEVAVTPDSKYLLVGNPAVSIVDLSTRTEIGTNPVQAQSLTVCSDNSVLTGDSVGNTGVHRFTIDSNGVMTDTGDNLGGISGDNVACASGTLTGLVPTFDGGNVISFGIPGLAAADVEAIAGGGQTAITNVAGTKAYVRYSDCSNPHVDYFNYDFVTGAMTPMGITITPTGGIGTDCWFAIDQLALYGNKLYVSANGAVEIYNATNGAFIGSITDASISNPTGIAIYLPPPTGIGLVADNASSSVVVFDPGTDTVTGVVPIPNAGVVGDVEVSKDGSLGFVGNFGNQVYVIDLKATPPRLASGTNPIAMSQAGEDLALTPDGNFLLSCDGGGNTTISVIDIASRTESSTFNSPCNAIQVCPDNSVLTAADGVGSHRLTIDGSGVITDTGESSTFGLMNTACGRSALTGLTVDYIAGITSFTIPGWGQIDQDGLSSATGQTVVSNRDGSRLFVRSSDCFTPFVDFFDYDFLSGQMTYSGITIPLAGGPVDCYYGIDQLAFNGDKLYASQSGMLGVYDANSGNLITSITDSAISNPTGVTVHIPNARANAASDSYNTDMDVQLNVPAPGVLTNDSDANGDLILAVQDGGPASGSLTLNSDGSFTYTPNAGFAGDDSFQYHVTDGFENSNIATVNIHVNAAPVAADDNYATPKNTQLNIPAPGVLGNDIDDGPITAVLDSGTSFGTLNLNSDGSFTYTPNAGFSGSDSFTYHDNDGSLNSNIATVNIDVINSAPVAADDNYSTARNGQLTVGAPGVLSNDSDADGDVLSAALDSQPPNGTVTLNADGSFTYTPDSGFVGIDTFTYHANDGTANSNIVNVNIDVINDAPTAVDDSYVTDKNVVLNIPAPGVITNDTDPNGDPLSAFLDAGPANGLVTLNADGSFSYTPNPDYVGLDSFTYHVKDGLDDSNIATVNLTVNQTCLFCDDFNDGTIDPNWTYVKPTWTEGGGNLMGTPVKKRATAAATPVFAGCQMCSMEASMQTAGGISNKLWLLGWYVDRKNTMELLMKEESERWVLKQRVNGRVVAKAKGIKTIDPNTAYAARIVFDGTSFQVFVDDFQTPLFTLTPQGSVPTGTVGFSVKNTTGSFDYVTVN